MPGRKDLREASFESTLARVCQKPYSLGFSQRYSHQNETKGNSRPVSSQSVGTSKVSVFQTYQQGNEFHKECQNLSRNAVGLSTSGQVALSYLQNGYLEEANKACTQSWLILSSSWTGVCSAWYKSKHPFRRTEAPFAVLRAITAKSTRDR